MHKAWLHISLICIYLLDIYSSFTTALPMKPSQKQTKDPQILIDLNPFQTEMTFIHCAVSWSIYLSGQNSPLESINQPKTHRSCHDINMHTWQFSSENPLSTSHSAMLKNLVANLLGFAHDPCSISPTCRLYLTYLQTVLSRCYQLVCVLLCNCSCCPATNMIHGASTTDNS